MGYIKLSAVAIETTANWSEDIIAKAGRIWEINVYDAGSVTHLCEFTPSFALYPVNYVSARRLDDDTDEEVRQAIGYDVSYMHTHIVEGLPGVDLFPPCIRYRQEDYDEAMEAAVQAYVEQPPHIPALEAFLEPWDGEE